MKITLYCFILLISLGTSGQSNIDVLHYRFTIGLNDVNDTLHGVAEIKLKFLSPSNTISLDLSEVKASKGGMTISDVKGLRYTSLKHENGKIHLALPVRYNAGDTAGFVISYSGIPSDGLIISKTKYGRRSFFADNWPDRGHNWIPCHEDPADKATVEFIITAPEHYQVVANGIQIEETSYGNGFKTTHWKEDTPISTKVMVIGVADFAVQLVGFANGNIPVYSWVYPEDRNNGFHDYGMAKEILPYFIERVGPYGYKKLANVQSKTRFGGLENANTIFYSENSVTGTRKSEGLLVHEIAHQWFGNMATEKSFGHLWLSEGFATYFTILYFENKYGKDTAIKMLREDREQVLEFAAKTKKAVVDTAESDYMNLLNPNSYQKGGWVLHMLRSELGDSVFWQSIRKYYTTYAGAVAGTRDLQRIFESVSGKDLNQFFNQWLYTAGQPQISITWEYDEVAGRLKAIISQEQQQTFHFPFEIKLLHPPGNSTTKTIHVSGRSTSFEIYTKEKVTRLVPDPGTKLLAGFRLK